jgi:Flp pilus assembly pilin Flp
MVMNLSKKLRQTAPATDPAVAPRSDDSGQAMTEYVIAVFFGAMAILGVLAVFSSAVVTYYRDVMDFLQTPFP